MRVLVEVLSVIAGLVAAYTIGALSAWSYPLGRDNIWLVTHVAMVVVLLMGIGPIVRAYRADREHLDDRG